MERQNQIKINEEIGKIFKQMNDEKRKKFRYDNFIITYDIEFFYERVLITININWIGILWLKKIQKILRKYNYVKFAIGCDINKNIYIESKEGKRD